MKIAVMWAYEKFDFIMMLGRKVRGYWTLKPRRQMW